MVFPEPVIHVAIEPKTKSDQDKLGKALKSLSDEDPTFRVRTDEETGQTIISGMGELHLEVLVDRMVREFNVEATVGKPQVAYRETDHQEGRVGRVPPHQAVGRLRPVRGDQAHRRAESRQGLRVRRRHPWRAHPARVHPTRPTRASRPRSTPACSPDTAWSTSRCRSSTASTTTSTRRRWRSRSPARWASRRPPARPPPCCSSRSWRSRSSRPRSTWAT